MKTISLLVMLVSTIFLSTSCRNNRLKSNEKELANKILQLEKENKDKTELEKESSKAPADNSRIFRKKEIRSVDPQSPPVKINIPGAHNNTVNFKLSNVASSIRYVKLQTPPDTLLLYDHFYSRNDLMSIIRSDGENIIFQGLFGLTRFNMQGEYQETIWKNETGISLHAGLAGFGSKDFFGVMPNNPVSMSDGNLYYSFNDGPAGKGQVLKYKPRTYKNLSVPSQTEVSGPGTLPGDTLFSTSINPWDRYNCIFGIGSGTWSGVNHKWNAGISGSLLVTYNEKGDTLCQFTDYDRIENFSKSTYRQSAELVSYYYNGLLTIKQEYNDTVFRLVPPDRLLPAYIIDFGENKVNYKDGLNPDIDLSGKYIIHSLHETHDFLFLRYTQNHDGSNNRKNKTVKFYNVIFDKKYKKLYHQPGFAYIPQGFINDLDGGMAFWPDFITPQGEMMKLVSGKVMKDYVKSTSFIKTEISAENRQKQISMASRLRATDMIIIIVK